MEPSLRLSLQNNVNSSALIAFIPQRAPDNSRAVSSLAQQLIPNEVFTDPFDQQDKICKVVLEKIQKGDLVLIKQYKNELSQIRDRRGRTLLMQATANWQQDIVEQLVRLEIGVHDVDTEGNTALHCAAGSGALSLLTLLTQNLSIQTLNRNKQTPLHSAILAGQSQVVEFLLKKGANINTPCIYLEFQVSAFPLAVMVGDADCVDALIKSGRCKFDEKTPGLGNILHIAITFHQIDLMKHLFKNYPSQSKSLLELQDDMHLTPFNLAGRYGEIQALILLKEQAANVEASDDQGRRPLHQAVLGGQLEAFPWLLFLGCKINKLDLSGKTAPALARDLANKKQDISIIQSIANRLENYALQKGTFEKPQWIVTSYENLVFQGGGPKGIAHLGALKYLQEKNLLKDIRRVAGTSAGAITACLLAVGYDVPLIEDILSTTDMVSFLDHPLSSQKLETLTGSSYKAIQALHLAYRGFKKILNPLQIVQDLWHSTGICEGTTILNWLEEKIAKQTGISNCTFKELREELVNKNKGKHLHVFAIRIGDKKEIIRFSSEEERWDNLIIAHAIRCSMSIPGAYQPHVLHYKDPHTKKIYPRLDLGSYVDGGMLYNFPIDAFDEKAYQQMEFFSENDRRGIKFNRHTLGFSLKVITDENHIEAHPVETVGELLKSFGDIYYNAEELIRKTNPNNVERIVELDIPKEVGTLSFGLPKEKQLSLVQAAYAKTKARLEEKLKPIDKDFFFNS